MTSGVNSSCGHENLSTRSENKFQKATLCAIRFATKLSFPKRFHCDLEGLFFSSAKLCSSTRFWAEKHAQQWSLCNFFSEKKMRSGFLCDEVTTFWCFDCYVGSGLASKCFADGSWIAVGRLVFWSNWEWKRTHKRLKAKEFKLGKVWVSNLPVKGNIYSFWGVKTLLWTVSVRQIYESWANGLW